LKLLRQTPPDPGQLSLQLDLFAADTPPAPVDGQAAPAQQSPDRQTPVVPVPPAAPPTAPPATLPGQRRRIQLRDHTLDYRLARSRRRSIGFLIDDDGLRITAPKWVTIAEIENAIREKQRWISSKLAERRERAARRLQPQMQWRDGAPLPYLGRNLTLRILAAQAAGISFDAERNELAVSLPPGAGEQQLKDRVQGWLQLEARRVFGERLPHYAEKLGVSYKSFALSSATTQWGSCTADRRIRLNWRLIHFALPTIDYVVAHELSHLREMNHSPRFWATVQSIFPEFEAAKKVLRESGPETLPPF